jgi:hypothetical protein
MLDARTPPKPLVPEDVKQKLIRELMPTDRLRSAVTEILIPRLRPGAADLHDQGRQNP